MWDIGYTPGSLGVYENSAFWTRLDNQVNASISRGIVPIICGWHAVLNDAPDGSNSINVANFMSSYHTWADYIKVYKLLAQRYADRGVIYEMYNEPLYCSWSTYKTEMEATIDTIRTYDANAVVVVQAVGSGDRETQSLQFVQTYPLLTDQT